MREKIRCDTGLLPNPERVARPHPAFAQRVPYKSFIIIGLTKINTAPRGAGPNRSRLDTHFPDYFGYRRSYAKVCRLPLSNNATNNADAGNILLTG